MREAICDTGPCLHLYEIGQQAALGIFDHLTIPDLVAKELRTYGIDIEELDISGLKLSIVAVATKEWQSVIHRPEVADIQPADAQVFVLAQTTRFKQLVLTDDLALRRHLETYGTAVVGSVGVLVRAYGMGWFRHNELEEAVDALFEHSTLYVSRVFRTYVHHLLSSLERI